MDILLRRFNNDFPIYLPKVRHFNCVLEKELGAIFVIKIKLFRYLNFLFESFRVTSNIRRTFAAGNIMESN